MPMPGGHCLGSINGAHEWGKWEYNKHKNKSTRVCEACTKTESMTGKAK